MRICSFHHGPSEGLGEIGDWIRAHGHALTETHFYRGEEAPALEDFDWLIIMGGAMNVYQYRDHPWLQKEKRCLEKAIETGKVVLGICLGAQLIADVLGARVYQNSEIEIGWFPVRFRDAVKTIAPFKKFPPELTPLHWHGDTFDLPPGAVALAESDACKNQAFALGDNIVGLQFHLEARAEDVESFLEDLPEMPGRFVQTRAEILAGQRHAAESRAALHELLATLANPDNAAGKTSS